MFKIVDMMKFFVGRLFNFFGRSLKCQLESEKLQSCNFGVLDTGKLGKAGEEMNVYNCCNVREIKK